jgi:hypothetical protein
MMPTRRLSRLTTGKRRTFISPMFCAMSSRFLVVEAVETSWLITVRRPSSSAPCLPRPRECNVAIGDHANQPIVFADRQHPGIDLRHHLAASRMLCLGLATCTSRLIQSQTFIGLPPSRESFVLFDSPRRFAGASLASEAQALAYRNSGIRFDIRAKSGRRGGLRSAPQNFAL